MELRTKYLRLGPGGGMPVAKQVTRTAHGAISAVGQLEERDSDSAPDNSLNPTSRNFTSYARLTVRGRRSVGTFDSRVV